VNSPNQVLTTPRASRVLAFTGAFLPGYKAGGPIKSIVKILDDLPDSVRVTLVTADRDLGDTVPYPGLSGRVVKQGQHEIYYLNTRDPRHWMALWRWARRNPIDLMYLNSLWSPVFTMLPIVAHRLGLMQSREVLLAPRGELSPGALRIKSRKKTLSLRGWAPLLRSIDPVWHASTEMEEQEIRQVFPWARTVIQIDSDGDAPRKDIITSQRRARFVFISRISEKKNLSLALEAFQLVQSDVDFDIFGPQEDADYWTTCQRLIDNLPANVRATYQGMLRPDQIQGIFARYDGFILPTLGENFGHVIAESLSAGCPVICSRETPWTGVLQTGGGAALAELDAGSWAEEITLRAEQSPAQRSQAKNASLNAYVAWREGLAHRLAIMQVLEDTERGTPGVAGRCPGRIALVTQGYQSPGGVPTVARWLAAGLRSKGFEVEVFDLATSRADAYSRRLTSPASWLRPTMLAHEPSDVQVTHVGANAVEVESFRYLPRTELSYELSRYDLVQVVAGTPSLALAAARCQNPIVLQVATTVASERASQLATGGSALDLWRRAMTRVTSSMERRALCRVDAVLVENSQMAELVRSVSPTQVLLAPPGVDTERFTPRPGGWDSSGYLLSVCRLDDPRKGLDRLIRSYALMTSLHSQVPDLIMAGRGELPAELKLLIAEMDLETRIHVRSNVPQAELPSLYQGASVYLQTSHEEGLGISVLEAMASGLPVVSTETAGTLETVASGNTGWLVSQESDLVPIVASRTISVLATDGHTMSAFARSRAESVFSEQVTLTRFLEVYHQLIGSAVSRDHKQ
jgi:glycosyltransferase involved in cell wall biosynthesis